jgi:AbrB family looped-hinge helix DNA binding protein
MKEPIMARKSKTSGAASQAQGFGEAPQAAFFALDETTPGFGVSNRLRLTLGPGGRVVIPAALREAMEVNEGDALLAWVEDGELHLLSPRVGARQARALLRGLLPEGESLADELIADRRREAAAESRG